MSVTYSHTLGPWTVDGPPDNQIVWSGTDTRVCFLAHSNGHDEARDIAIGKLIAAAPDLLEALKEATLALEGFSKGEGVFKPIEQTIVMSRAAIAKAEGGAA